MPLVISLAGLGMGMAPAEALWAATRGGAKAVGEADRVGSFPARSAIWWCSMRPLTSISPIGRTAGSFGALVKSGRAVEAR